MIIEHSNIFPIFVSEFDLTDHECNSLVIKKIDTYYEKKDPTLYNNNKERFLNEPDLIELWKTFQECCDIYCENANIKPVIVSSNWINALQLDDNLRAHRHPVSVISGVYYPYIELTESPLIFEHPASPIIKEHNIRRILKNFNNTSGLSKKDYEVNDIEFHPQNESLIIFPSYLNHWVNSSTTNKRYTVVFNTLLYSERKSFKPHLRDYRIEPHEDK
jgi:hypothetical protein